MKGVRAARPSGSCPPPGLGGRELNEPVLEPAANTARIKCKKSARRWRGRGTGQYSRAAKPKQQSATPAWQIAGSLEAPPQRNVVAACMLGN